MRKVLFILGQLNDSDVEWLATVGERRQIAPGTELIHEGTDIDAVYIILDGQMSVWVRGHLRIATATTGDILGEMSLIDAGRTSASLKCERESIVLAVPKAVLSRRLETDVGFAARFYKAIALCLADRMRSVVKRMGYGELEDEPAVDPPDRDELEATVLDSVHLAGARFERMLRKLLG
jgi:CRP-like cAMP-binding protein